jgi:hypothetical protein
MFAACLAAPPPPPLDKLTDDMDVDLPADEAMAEMDTSLLNLVGGDGAIGLAEKWAESGKLRKKIEIVRRWLGVKERRTIDSVLEPVVAATGKEVPRVLDSEDEDSNYGEADDERGRTAHLLFAGLAGIEDKPSQWDVASSSAPATPSSAARVGKDNTNARYGAFLTPVSSPMRFLPRVAPLDSKGKKRAIESPVTSLTPLAKRARVALGSPFEVRRQRYDESAWLSISNPSSPLRSVGNTVAQPVASSSKLPPGPYGSSAGGSLPCTPREKSKSPTNHFQAASDLLQSNGSLFPSRRITSPSGGVYTFYEVLPASSPAPQQSPNHSPSPRRTKKSSILPPPPTLECIEAERNRLDRRLKLHDRLWRDNPTRVISTKFAKKRKKLEHRHFVLKTKCDNMAMVRTNKAQVRRVPSFETVYDAGEPRLKDYEADKALRGKIDESLRLGLQPMVPLLVSAKSQAK